MAPKAPLPPPVILTKLEAIQFAADQLTDMAKQCDLIAMIVDAIGGGTGNLPAEAAARLRELRQAMPEPKLQAMAMREGAKAISELALEERLVAARVAAKGAQA
jgi:hypothetical protein